MLLGIKRVAILDFDVHHGNGTQVRVGKDGVHTTHAVWGHCPLFAPEILL